MSTGNTAKLGTAHSIELSVSGWDRTYNALVSILLSQRINPPCQTGVNILVHFGIHFNVTISRDHKISPCLQRLWVGRCPQFACLRQKWHNSKCIIFQEELLKVYFPHNYQLSYQFPIIIPISNFHTNFQFSYQFPNKNAQRAANFPLPTMEILLGRSCLTLFHHSIMKPAHPQQLTPPYEYECSSVDH